MKAIKLLLVLFCLPLFSFAQDIDLKGQWKNEKLDITYQFFSASKGYFIQQIAGTPFDYTIKTDTEPYRMDMTVKSGAQELLIPALLKVVDENTIWIEQFTPMSNPTAFTEGEDAKNRVHILKRKQ